LRRDGLMAGGSKTLRHGFCENSLRAIPAQVSAPFSGTASFYTPVKWNVWLSPREKKGHGKLMSIYPRRPKPTVWPLYVLPLFALFVAVFLLAWRFGPSLLGLTPSAGPPTHLREVKYRDGLYEYEKSLIEIYKRV